MALRERFLATHHMERIKEHRSENLQVQTLPTNKVSLKRKPVELATYDGPQEVEVPFAV
jgi:hypothetical protein